MCVCSTAIAITVEFALWLNLINSLERILCNRRLSALKYATLDICFT